MGNDENNKLSNANGVCSISLHGEHFSFNLNAEIDILDFKYKLLDIAKKYYALGYEHGGIDTLYNKEKMK